MTGVERRILYCAHLLQYLERCLCPYDYSWRVGLFCSYVTLELHTRTPADRGFLVYRSFLHESDHGQSKLVLYTTVMGVQTPSFVQFESIFWVTGYLKSFFVGFAIIIKWKLQPCLECLTAVSLLQCWYQRLNASEYIFWRQVRRTL